MGGSGFLVFGLIVRVSVATEGMLIGQAAYGVSHMDAAAVRHVETPNDVPTPFETLSVVNPSRVTAPTCAKARTVLPNFEVDIFSEDRTTAGPDPYCGQGPF